MILRILSLGWLCAVIGVRAATIEQAVVDQIGTNQYTISFKASQDTGDIALFASSRADRIDTEKPVVEKAVSPVTVTVASTNRVYFHLKPVSGRVRVVSIRAIPLEGGINFRDLGGYATTNGQHVRWGLIYRSAKLDQLTLKDFAYLENLNIKLVCDFRIESERNRALTHWEGTNAPEIFFDPIDTVNGPRRSQQAARQGAQRGDGAAPARGAGGGGLANTYRWMATEGLDEFGALMRRIADGESPTIFHCQEGRGRTGVFAALLLATLGVPRDTIMQDFLLTNDLLLSDEALAKMRNTNGRSGQSLQALRQSLAVSAEDLKATFSAIDQKFPTWDAFVGQGLKLTPSELAALKSRLLEP